MPGVPIECLNCGHIFTIPSTEPVCSYCGNKLSPEHTVCFSCGKVVSHDAQTMDAAERQSRRVTAHKREESATEFKIRTVGEGSSDWTNWPELMPLIEQLDELCDTIAADRHGDGVITIFSRFPTVGTISRRGMWEAFEIVNVRPPSLVDVAKFYLSNVAILPFVAIIVVSMAVVAFTTVVPVVPTAEILWRPIVLAPLVAALVLLFASWNLLTFARQYVTSAVLGGHVQWKQRSRRRYEKAYTKLFVPDRIEIMKKESKRVRIASHLIFWGIVVLVGPAIFLARCWIA